MDDTLRETPGPSSSGKQTLERLESLLRQCETQIDVTPSEDEIEALRSVVQERSAAGDLAPIRRRWGFDREDFDWSLHGSASRGEQAVKDIRTLLGRLEAPRAGDPASSERERIAANLLDAKYMNPECGEHGCQFLKRAGDPVPLALVRAEVEKLKACGHTLMLGPLYGEMTPHRVILLDPIEALLRPSPSQGEQP